MHHALRIIDANANRAREALRVMEDAARFALDHRPLCAALKALRHEFAGAVAGLPGASAMIAWRDAGSDVGTVVVGSGESGREGVRGVVVAAGKRLTEALRSVEEFAKALGDPAAAATIESLRYRAYDLERDLVLALGAARGWTGGPSGAGAAPRLCVLITASLCTRHPWENVARHALDGGADALQLREKALPDAELLDRARRLVAIARSQPHDRRAIVVVNDRPDIALLSGADGVHLGQSDLPIRDARRILGADRLIGVSTQTLDQAHAARAEGADVCGVGPMFETSTKPARRPVGPEALRGYLSADPALPPCLAIGGITPACAAELRRAADPYPIGTRWGIAVSSAVCAAEDPSAACRELLRAAGAPG